MKSVLFLGTLLASQVSMAAPGGPLTHTLSCKGAGLGVGYEVIVTSQALAPQYSIRSCTLVRNLITYPPSSSSIDLTPVQQDANSATFAENGVTITLDKSTFTARLSINSNSNIVCGEEN